MAACGAWEDFWNQADVGLYVNKRNLEAHFARLAADLTPYYPSCGAVLDYGCGDALAADPLSRRCGSLTLFDAAPAVRRRLAQRFAGRAGIIVAHDENDPILSPPGGFDLITVVSVAQYIPRDALPSLMRRWRGMLAPDGRLLLADVAPPDASAWRDAASQLTFAAQNGFLTAAMIGMVRLIGSDYRKIRKAAGFSTYAADEIIGLLRDAGFNAERLLRNIGPTPHRLSFIATRA